MNDPSILQPMETENCTVVAPAEVKKEEPTVNTELTPESALKSEKLKVIEQPEKPNVTPIEANIKVEEPTPIVEPKIEAPEPGLFAENKLRN